MFFQVVASLLAYKKTLFTDQCFSKSGSSKARKDFLHFKKKNHKKS